MTKVKLKDATNGLAQNAGSAWENAVKAKRSAEGLMQALKKLENQFVKEEEQRRAQEKQLEQQKLIEQHTKAYTMPDEDDVTPEEQSVATPDAGTKTAEKAAKSAKKADKPAKNAEEKVEKPEEKTAEPAKEPAQADEEKPAKQVAAPVPQQGAPRPAGQPGVPGQPRPMGQPGVPGQPRSMGQPGVPGQPRPMGQPGVPGQPRPMGQPGVPGQPRPQGPYGRPANPNGFAPRPQGPYGRPANPNGFAPRPQGPYGRPANPNGFAPRPQQGPYGRPANGGQGGFSGNRPQGGGFGNRPQGGGFGNRPQQRSSNAGSDLAPVIEKERVSNYDPNKKNYIRQHDPERVAKNRKQLVKESLAGNYDDDVVRGGRKSRSTKKPSAQQMMAPIKIEKAYMTAETITVKDLTERIGKPAGDILKKLLLMDIMANINSELDFDTASLVAGEFGVELEMKMDKTAEDALSDENYTDTEDNLVVRPPVVTIMGHVDHGKTSLLDYIRKAHVTNTEAGGITQHIGAYTVSLKDQQITFLDTPGHEAFTAMRARGTQATDIAILVVAADDGVMPQTIESINHAKAANVPVIVAINKMDKPGADPDRVKQDLTSYNLVPEEWGGDTIMVPVSALTGEGVDQLLEMILLEAEMKQLRANPDRKARGVIIEAKLDKARGPLATILVQNGTLKIGDNIVAGMAFGRVRSMVNDRGERVTTAGPSTPVEVAGFTEVPEAGDEMMAVEDDRLSRQVAQERRDKQKASRVVATASKMSLDNLFSQIDQGKVVTLNLIIKADVQGSVEAVKQAMEKLSNDEVKVRVLHSAAGAITKDDVNLASAFNAIIIGFNIRPDNNAREIAEKEHVDVRLYRIIYQAIEDMEKAMKGLLAPQFKEVVLGHAEIRTTFRITGAGTIAGCYVKDGKMQRNAEVRLLRDNVVVFEGKLSSLKHFKDDAKEMAAGFECGVSLEGYNDIKEGDIIECFVNEEIER